MGNSLADFEIWLHDAEPGSQTVYYHGQLARDRVRMVPDEFKAGWYHEQPIEPLNTLANLAWEAYESGLVCLTQKKTESGYLYLATRTWKDNFR